MTASEEGGQELGPYTEVADTLIFAAVERAVLHEQEDEVLTSELTEHLGFKPEPDTNHLQLRVNSHKLSQVPKRGFLGLGLGAGVIGESLKTLCAVALLGDVGRHCPVLGEECILARI